MCIALQYCVAVMTGKADDIRSKYPSLSLRPLFPVTLLELWQTRKQTLPDIFFACGNNFMYIERHE